MELAREFWKAENCDEFQKHLVSLGKGDEKAAWEKNLLKTQMKCIAVPSPQIKAIIKEIHRGNFMQFIDLWLWENFSNTVIIGGLICKIKYFNIFRAYLKKYAASIDNWGSADMLSFNVNDKNKEDFYLLAKEYISDEKTFARRIGITILLKLINYDGYVDKVFDLLNYLIDEKEYYVNMAASWVLCDCFIKHREKTILFLSNHRLNNFILNKAIQKCRESFRVSDEDKQMLIKYKKK